MSPVTTGLLAAAALFALVYGVGFVGRPPSVLRTLVKAAGAACLCLAARLADAPSLLAFAFALCAAGDAVLAQGERQLLGGVVTFLIAHLGFIALFLEIGDPHRLTAPGWPLAGAVVALAWTGALLARLWPGLGAMRASGAAYAAALFATVASALTLGPEFRLAWAGAGLFLVSDSILAVRLFGPDRAPSRLWDGLVWWTYAAALGLIAWAFLHG